MDTILIFDRPFTSRFNAQYRAVHDGVNILTVSDWKYRDDVGLVRKQYKHLATAAADADHGLDYEVVARRCRYLRTLDPVLQRRLINSAWLAINEIFDSIDVRALIGLPMDNYYLDLFDQVCTKRGIFATFPVQSFLPQRTRITRRGEHIEVRQPADDEVAQYREVLLRRNFRPTWLSPDRSRTKLMKMYLREVAKKIFFNTAKIVKGDPYSFHYNGVFLIAPALNTASGEVLKIRDIFVSDLDEIGRRAAQYERVVFLPLQFSPESSLDYNIPDSRFSWYEKLLDTIIERLPADTMLIVKEHPDMFGYRRYAFFERFLGKPNVVLADVGITVQQIFDFAGYILVTGSASTGAEAVIKGRTVISLGGAFYGGIGAIHEIMDFDDMTHWGDWLRPIHNDSAMLDRVVRRMLSNTLFGPYDFVRTPRAALPAARANARTILYYVLAASEPVEVAPEVAAR